MRDRRGDRQVGVRSAFGGRRLGQTEAAEWFREALCPDGRHEGRMDTRAPLEDRIYSGSPQMVGDVQYVYRHLVINCDFRWQGRHVINCGSPCN